MTKDEFFKKHGEELIAVFKSLMITIGNRGCNDDFDQRMLSKALKIENKLDKVN